MISKILRAPFVKSIKSLSNNQAAGFAKKPVRKSESIVTKSEEPVQSYESPEIVETKPLEKLNVVRPGEPLIDVKDRLKLQNYAHMTYKQYSKASHNDPQSHDYIPSERDEYHDRVKVSAYNQVIDGIKNDLKIQQEVYKILESLDRPYKQGHPGNTKNITGGVRDYFPAGNLGFKPVEEDWATKFFERHFSNADRYINQTIFYPKYSKIQSDLEWQNELENRPVTKHFHHDKGYKYDVEVPWDQRHPHVADRMGYPEILGTPFERLMRLEGEIYHPTYLDQAFVQIPSPDPHTSLNFEEGEVIYENTQILEWAKFWNLSGFSLYAFGALFIPYNLLYKTHMPTSTAYEQLFVPYYSHTMFFFDNMGLHIPAIGSIAMYATYLAIAASNKIWRDYVVKMQYSKDKELLFVTRISPYCSLEEEVYEVNHLEVLPPSVKTGVTDLSSQDKDGLWDITCLASHRNLVVYNEDKYWNPTVRKEFFDKVMNFWTPDLIKPSRVEEYNQLLNGPKIELGAESRSQLEGN